MAIWLPGYTRVNLGLSGKPFEYTHNPKGLLHSTEGTSLAGAESAMRAYPSHLGYDYRTREKHQYISLDLAAYSAMDESDNDPIYQVELVGFAKDMRYLPDWALRNIAEDVVKPLRDTVGIPDIVIPVGFKDGLDGIYPYLATPQSPIRLSYAGLRQFSGWLGHQHLPAPDDHWDPGKIDIHRILVLSHTREPGDEDGMSLSLIKGDQGAEIWLVAVNEHGAAWKIHLPTIELVNVYKGLLGKEVRSVPQWIIDYIGRDQGPSTQPVSLSAEDRAAVVAELAKLVPDPATTAKAVVAEFKKEGN